MTPRLAQTMVCLHCQPSQSLSAVLHHVSRQSFRAQTASMPVCKTGQAGANLLEVRASSSSSWQHPARRRRQARTRSRSAQAASASRALRLPRAEPSSGALAKVTLPRCSTAATVRSTASRSASPMPTMAMASSVERSPSPSSTSLSV